MGNSNPSELSLITTIEHPQRWESLGFHENYEIFQNLQTGEQIEQTYVYTGFQRSHQQEMREYLYRRMQPTNVVRVLFAERTASNNFCSGSDKYRVWTERIPLRLCNLNNLPLPQALSILKEALLGYQTIYEYGKRATVTDEMIGLTPEGKVKVWVNASFGDNKPQSYSVEIRSRPVYLTQADVIAQVIETVRQHTHDKQFPERLQERLSRDLTFSEANRIVSWYCRQEHIQFPERIVVNSMSSKPDTMMTFRASPKQSIRDGVSRPQSVQHENNSTVSSVQTDVKVGGQINPIIKPLSMLVHQSNTPSRYNTNQVKKDLVDPINKRCNRSVQSSNPVVNLQSRALQLKQQTTQINRKPANLESAGPTTHLQFKRPQNQRSSRVVSRDTLRENIFAEPRDNSFKNSSHKRNLSENYKQIDSRLRQRNHSPASHHLLAHKNPPILDSSAIKKQTHHFSSSLDKKIFGRVESSIDRREVSQPKPLSNNPQIKRQQFMIRATQPSVSPSLQLPTSRRIPQTGKQFKPEFSFDPKFHTQNIAHIHQNSISPIQSVGSSSSKLTSQQQSYDRLPINAVSYEHSMSKTKQNLQTPLYIKPSSSGYFVRNFTQNSGYRTNNSGTTQTMPMTLSVEGSRQMDTSLTSSKVPDEAKFLQEKIKQIQQQLKNIAYLDSQHSITKRSQQLLIKGSHPPPVSVKTLDSLEDLVKTSKSIQKQ